MITSQGLAQTHEQSAKVAFKSSVERLIDAHLEKNWFPENPVTIVLDEVYPDADKRVRAFIVPLIEQTYGNDTAGWNVRFENGVFMFKARSDHA